MPFLFYFRQMFWPLDTLWLVVGGALAAALLVALRPAQPGSRVLVVTLVFIANSTFCYSMGLLARGAEAKRAWNHAEYATEPFVVGLMLVLVLRQIRREQWVRPWPLALIFCVPALAVLANWTNDWHHLYYRAVSLDSDGPVVYLSRERGPMFWLLHAQILSALGLAMALLVGHRRQAPRTQRRGSSALLVALGLMLAMDGIHLGGVALKLSRAMPYLGVLTTFALVGWALLRWQWLDLAPLARGALLENMAEALVVLDQHGRVTDFNQRAAAWLGCSDAAYGRPAAQLPGLAWLRLEPAPTEPVSHQMGPRLVRCLVMPLRSRRGHLSGWLLLGRDETRQHAVEVALQNAHVECARNLQRALAQSVSVQEEEQRRIGHDIHDSLCQDLAGLARSGDRLASGLAALGAPPLQAQAQALAQEASRILKVTRTLAHDLALTDLGFLRFEDSLADFGEHVERWLGIQLEINLDEEVPIRDKEIACHLLRIIREAVINATRHGHARRVWVDLVRRDQGLLVTVSNDGLPLPPEADRREGLGLRQMRMRARLLGGQLSLRNQPPDTVSVELAIPEALLRLPAEERMTEAALRPAAFQPNPHARPTA